MRFTDKTALITGATGGIGRSTSLLFAAEGAHVAVTDIELEPAERLAAEIRATGGRASAHLLDVTDDAQTQAVVDAVVAETGRIDIAFCNAGIREIVPAQELPLTEWRKVIDVNVTGVFTTAQAVAHKMIADGKGGAIVNTASTLGVMAANSRCAYATSKHAVVGMTKALAIDLAPFHIRVNAVGPGVIRTPLTERYFQDPEMHARVNNIHALGRVGVPDEIGKAVLYLASDEASFCTGTHLVIDGGWTAGKSM
ncbi:MAG: glucose 1-dehydrogenase [Pseudomonadota bacterium]|nr:glucose 1-dehydrogenase [Alphaproteobacteria bacterium]MEE3107213.1 glucose 1-dehydrogenase [Pseudomonadota bacterium]